eukprot:Clim_evm29s136 gene=Clim_evmTU29s136
MKSLTWISLAAGLAMTASARSKDPQECEVCIKVLTAVEEKMESSHFGNEEKTVELIEEICKEYDHESKEHTLCYYIGGLEISATGITREAARPLTNGIPVQKVCDKLKKKDSEICALKYDKPIDLNEVKLEKLKMKQLKKILRDWGEQKACANCVEKSEYIKIIRELRPKYDPTYNDEL